MPGVCLVMIVKNEAHVIGRCLASVRRYISRFLIVDTGSTDDTEKICRLSLEDIPGEIHKRPWRDFSTNRNEALELARLGGASDYALVMDADDTLEVSRVSNLTAPGYAIKILDGDLSYFRTLMFRLNAGYTYRGVVHESLYGPTPSKLQGVVYHRVGGGSRGADGKKAARDAKLLEAVVDPTPRDVYYLAQSYRDAGELEKARLTYWRRAGMNGFNEETFSAELEHAKLEERRGSPVDTVVEAYMRAHSCRPSRAEPLAHLARFLQAKADSMVKPDDALFVEDAVYKRKRFAVVVNDTHPNARAYDEVADSLVEGLHELGLEATRASIYQDNSCNIVLAPHLFSSPPPSGSILYSFEPTSTNDALKSGACRIEEWARSYELWDYSEANVAHWRSRGLTNVRHVPVGYSPCLTRIKPVDEDIDVLFYGSEHPRRTAVVDELQQCGLNAVYVSNVFGAGRDNLIARSKVVLNLHFYTPGIFESVRVSYLLANRKCVVSETGAEDDFHGGVVFADYDSIVDACITCVRDESMRRDVAKKGFELFRRRGIAGILARALGVDYVDEK